MNGGREATVMRKANELSILDPDRQAAVIIIDKGVRAWLYESQPGLLASVGFAPPQGMVSIGPARCWGQY